MNATTGTFASHLPHVLRLTPSRKAVARVRVAVNSRYQNSEAAWVDERSAGTPCRRGAPGPST